VLKQVREYSKDQLRDLLEEIRAVRVSESPIRAKKSEILTNLLNQSIYTNFIDQSTQVMFAIEEEVMNRFLKKGL
jgi:hypothetical protein